MYKILMVWDWSFGRTFSMASCRNVAGYLRDFYVPRLLAWRNWCQLQEQRISDYNRTGIIPSLLTSQFVSSRTLIKGKVVLSCKINIRSSRQVKWWIVLHKTDEKQNHGLLAPVQYIKVIITNISVEMQGFYFTRICILIVFIKRKYAGVKRAHIVLLRTITYPKSHSNALQCRPMTTCCSKPPFKWFSKSHCDSCIPKEKWLGSSDMKLLYCVWISAINKQTERIGHTDFCLSE